MVEFFWSFVVFNVLFLAGLVLYVTYIHKDK